MKKLLAFLLSAAMALTLAIPAMAAPEDAVPISGAPDEDFSWSTAEQAYLDAHPGLEEQLRASAYDFFAREVAGSMSPEEYMAYFEMTEEEFLDEMVLWQVSALLEAEEERSWVDAIKTALGGVPGQIGVMVNGEYVKFPDAVPEVTGGRTMVPVRAIVEALDGEADMAGGKVTCKANDTSLTFTPGSSEVLVEYTGGELPGDGQIFPMDCAPYIKGGRTYVPVRFLGEILGYEVGWDGQFQTAVLLDRDELAARYDEHFTIMNRVQANRGLTMEEGKNYKADVKGNLTVTAFDTLNGNQTYKADLSASQILNSEAANAKLSLKLSDNLRTMLKDSTSTDPEVRERLDLVLDALENLELIVTEKGLGWLHAAALDEAAGEKNVWLGLDLGAEWGQLAFAQTGDATMGSVLAAMIDVDSVESLPTAVSPAAQLLYELYGDDKFTTSGGVSTRTIGLDDLLALYKDMGLTEADLAEAKAAFQEFSITMKVDSKGGVTMACAMQTAALDGVPGLKLAMDVKQDSGNAAISMTLHIANIGEGRLTLTQTWSTTSGKPQDQPPEGAIVVDPAELLNP
ncbi:MAG: hypothetical protein HFF22_06720 [Oscillospiraceae bacterium]|jgi:hypothetical protein|nr:hypothetical protein [Oscillospiraceae bacterium]